jgi:hypothetical protein
MNSRPYDCDISHLESEMWAHLVLLHNTPQQLLDEGFRG